MTKWRRPVSLLATTLLFVGVVFTIGAAPRAAAIAAQSPGCAELNKSIYDGTYSDGPVTPPLQFNLGDTIRATFSDGTTSPSAQRIRVAPAEEIRSDAASGTLTYFFDHDAITTVQLTATPGPKVWTVTCESAQDLCAALNSPIFDGRGTERSLAGASYLLAGDQIVYRLIGTGTTDFTLYDDGVGAYYSPGVQLPATLSTGTNFTTPWQDFRVTSSKSVTWDISCTRSVAFACEDGSPVPEGYTLVEGTSGSDNIFGGSGNQLYRLGAGNDTVNDLSGNDIMCGGDDADTLNGGGGNDAFIGGAGTDTLNGGSGTDSNCEPNGGDNETSIEREACPTYRPVADGPI